MKTLGTVLSLSIVGVASCGSGPSVAHDVSEKSPATRSAPAADGEPLAGSVPAEPRKPTADLARAKTEHASTPVSAAATPDDVLEPALPVTKLVADPARSHVRLHLLKATGEHRLSFRRFEATVSIDGERVKALSVSVEIASLAAEPAPFRKDVLSRSFLDVAKHSHARFESTHVDIAASDIDRPVIAGMLEIRGVRRPVTLPIEVEFGPLEMRGRGRISFDVDEFGMKSPALDAEMVDRTVTLDVAFVFVRPNGP